MGGVPANVAEEVEYAVGALARGRAYIQEHRAYDVNASMEIVR